MRSARKTILKIFLDTVMLLLLAMMLQISPERCEDFVSDGVSISV